MYHTTIEGNDAPAGGGAYSFSGGELVLVNSIIANSMQGGGLFADGLSSIVTSYCDVWNNTGGDYIGCTPSVFDISCPPQYCDMAHNDLRLYETSECQGAGEGGTDIGAKGVGCFTIPDVLFYDNFSDQNDEGWLAETAGDGEMSVVTGAYQGSATGLESWAMSQVVGPDLAFEDFHFWVDVRAASEIWPPTGFVDFYLRHTDFTRSYVVRLGAAVGQLWKFTPSGREFLLEFPFEFIPGEWTQMHFVVLGDELSAYVSGPDGIENLVFFYHDVLNPIPTGTVGVGVAENGPALAFFDNVLVALVDATGVESPEDVAEVPTVRLLFQNQPNPFNPSTVIRYEVPGPAAVSLRIYDIAGHLVDVLVDGETVAAGTHSATWTGRDSQGRAMPSGTYFYRLEAGGYCETRRMTLVR